MTDYFHLNIDRAALLSLSTLGLADRKSVV